MTPVERKASELGAAIQAAKTQLEGVHKFYDASLIMKNNVQADKYRAQAHALLDVILDNTAALYSLIQSSQKT
jgi:hypothetical protein